MSIRGVFASHSGIVGERRGDFASRILMSGYTGTAPLLALSSGMPNESVTDTAFSWTEDTHISGNTTATQTVNAAATTLTVADTNIWTPNTIVQNQTTGEHVFVSAINGLTVTLIRGIQGTTASSITSGDVLQSVGTAFAEGSGRPEPVAQRGESRTNYVQIFKNGWAITGTANKVKFTTGDQLGRNRQMATAYHAEDLERAFMFGRPGVMFLNQQQLRTSAGIDYQIRTFGGLVESAAAGGTAGDMNLDGIINFMRRLFDRNAKGFPNERIAFTGSAVLELIQRMVRLDTRYNISVGESSYGIKVMKLLGFNGDLTLATHPLMTENSIWGRSLWVLHPGLIKRRTLRDTWSEQFGADGNTNNGIDAVEGYIAIEQGFQAELIETMGVMDNIQDAVAS